MLVDMERWLKGTRISCIAWPITFHEEFCFIQITHHTVELANLQMQQETEYPGNPVKVARSEQTKRN